MSNIKDVRSKPKVGVSWRKDHSRNAVRRRRRRWVHAPAIHAASHEKIIAWVSISSMSEKLQRAAYDKRYQCRIYKRSDQQK